LYQLHDFDMYPPLPALYGKEDISDHSINQWGSSYSSSVL